MQTPTVLIADDDTTWVKCMARLLETEGYRTLHARSGVDALYQARMRTHPRGPVPENSPTRHRTVTVRADTAVLGWVGFPGSPMLQMKSLLDVVLFLFWVAAYLTAVSWVVRYRKMQVHALGPTRQTEYRTDKDFALRLAILILGAVMLLVGYFATRMIGQYF